MLRILIGPHALLIDSASWLFVGLSEPSGSTRRIGLLKFRVPENSNFAEPDALPSNAHKSPGGGTLDPH